MIKCEAPLLDELERGPWPSFVVNLSPPEDYDTGEPGDGDTYD